MRLNDNVRYVAYKWEVERGRMVGGGCSPVEEGNANVWPMR